MNVRTVVSVLLAFCVIAFGGCFVPPPEQSRAGGSIQLQSIDGSASDNVWAIGLQSAVRWNGTSWTPQALPPGIGSLRDVTVLGPTDVWLAAQMREPVLQPAMIHWDGTTWITHPIDCTGFTECWVDHVSVVDATHVWMQVHRVLGQHESWVRLLWDGSAWQEDSLANPTEQCERQFVHRSGLWCRGTTTLFRRVDAGWIPVALPSAEETGAVIGVRSIASDTYLVTARELIVWNGTDFSSARIPVPPTYGREAPIDMAGTDPGNLWVVTADSYQCARGLFFPENSCIGRGLYHWDGVSWRAMFHSGESNAGFPGSPWEPYFTFHGLSSAFADETSVWILDSLPDTDGTNMFRFRQ